MNKGKFISFEGSEGCGKSTQIKKLSNRLEQLGIDVLHTREPGGTKLGESIRDLLQHAPEGENMTPESELLLFASSRAQLVREVISPALDKGAYVIADRFLDSTTIYQGSGRGINEEFLNQIHDFTVGDYYPDCTFLLDLSVKEGRKRIAERSNGKLDRMEREPDSFFEMIRSGYLDLARDNKDRFVVLDGSQSPEVIECEIWNYLNKKYGIGN